MRLCRCFIILVHNFVLSSLAYSSNVVPAGNPYIQCFGRWDFSKWTPDLVLICLGLNGYNGWSGYSGPVPQYDTDLLKDRYHLTLTMNEAPHGKSKENLTNAET